METKERTKNQSYWIKDITLTSLGWDLALPIFGGVFLGYQIDRRMTSSYTFTLVLLVIGIIIAYYNLYRIIEIEMLRTKSAKQKTSKKEHA